MPRKSDNISQLFSHGVWAIRPLFDGYIDQELSTKLMTLCKRRYAPGECVGGRRIGVTASKE